MQHSVEYEIQFGDWHIGTVHATLDIDASIDADGELQFTIDGVSMDDANTTGPDMLTSDDPMIKAIGQWIVKKAEGDDDVQRAAYDYARDTDHDADDWYDRRREYA